MKRPSGINAISVAIGQERVPAVAVGNVPARLNDHDQTFDINAISVDRDAIHVEIGQQLVPAVVVGSVPAGSMTWNDFDRNAISVDLGQERVPAVVVGSVPTGSMNLKRL